MPATEVLEQREDTGMMASERSTSACTVCGHGAAASAWPSPRVVRAAAAPERQLVGRDRRQLRRRGAHAAQRPDWRYAYRESVRLRAAETQPCAESRAQPYYACVHCLPTLQLVRYDRDTVCHLNQGHLDRHLSNREIASTWAGKTVVSSCCTLRIC